MAASEMVSRTSTSGDWGLSGLALSCPPSPPPRLFNPEASSPRSLAARVELYPSSPRRISDGEIRAAAAAFGVELSATHLEALAASSDAEGVHHVTPDLTVLGGRFLVLDKVLNSGIDKKVYAGIDLSTGLRIAIPILDKTRADSKSIELVKNEINILSQLQDSPYVVSFYGGFEDGKNIYLVEDYYPGGDLLDYIVGPLQGSQDLELWHHIAIELAKAVEDLHDRGFAHLDIKAENVLVILDEEGRFKTVRLCDLAFACPIANPHSERCGSPEYLAPEMFGLFERGSRAKTDVWSLATLVLALLTKGEVPKWFAPDKMKSTKDKYLYVGNQLAKYQRNPRLLWDCIPAHLHGALLPALTMDPERRCTSRELRERVEELARTVLGREERRCA